MKDEIAVAYAKHRLKYRRGNTEETEEKAAVAGCIGGCGKKISVSSVNIRTFRKNAARPRIGVWKGETIVLPISPIQLKQAVGPVGQDAVGGCGIPVEKAPFAWYIN